MDRRRLVIPLPEIGEEVTIDIMSLSMDDSDVPTEANGDDVSDDILSSTPLSTSKTNGINRASQYRPSYDKLVRNMRMLGYSGPNIAKIFGVHPSTLEHWRNCFASFKIAWFSGGPIADAKVARRLYMRACGYSHPAVAIFNDKDKGIIHSKYTKHYPPDTPAAQFWLINRQPEFWRSMSSAAQLSISGANMLAPPGITVNVIEHDSKVVTINGKAEESSQTASV